MTIATTAGTERNAGNIVKLSMQLAGLVYSGHAPNSDDESLGLMLLDTIVAELGTAGVTIKRQDLRTYSVTALDTTVTLDDDVSRVIGNGTWNTAVTPTETVLVQDSIQQWSRITDKTATGTPTEFWVEPTEPMTAHLYRIPTSDMYLNLVVQTEAADTNSSGVTLDLDPSWYQYLIWELAHQMSVSKMVDGERIAQLSNQAAQKRIFAVRHAKGNFGTQMILIAPTAWRSR